MLTSNMAQHYNINNDAKVLVHYYLSCKVKTRKLHLQGHETSMGIYKVRTCDELNCEMVKNMNTISLVTQITN